MSKLCFHYRVWLSELSVGHWNLVPCFLVGACISVVWRICKTRPFVVCSSFCSVLATLQGMWDLSSPTKDRTCTPAVEGWSLDHWTTKDQRIYKMKFSTNFYLYFSSRRSKLPRMLQGCFFWKGESIYTWKSFQKSSDSLIFTEQNTISQIVCHH